MRILIPQGIGDSIWALHKIQDLARKKGDGRVEALIACYDYRNVVEARALEFVKRFRFVDHADMWLMPRYAEQAGCFLRPGPPADEDGYYRYWPDGIPDDPAFRVDYIMIPNAALERGIRLENWLPEFEVNWDIMDEFQFTEEELRFADDFSKVIGPYAVFFLGAEDGNTYAGHNRGGVWRNVDWITLGQRIKGELGLQIVVVGAHYDRPYFDNQIKQFVDWHDYIGPWGIGQTYAVIRKARFIISYQSGIGIVANYFGVPTGIFWRAKGDSISPSYYLSFEEAMASAWANPKMIESGKHLPLIYGRHDVNYIMNEIKERKW